MEIPLRGKLWRWLPQEEVPQLPVKYPIGKSLVLALFSPVRELGTSKVASKG